LASNSIDAVQIPHNFISSFYNFIPGFLYEKSAELVSLHRDFNYSAPLGADSLFVNIVGNFGYIFGCVYFLGLGLFLSWIYDRSRSSVWWLTYYLAICSVIPFQFFRDGFFIINKMIYWNMLAVPLTIIFFENILRTFALYRRRFRS
jgi:hypothetical protein